MHSITTWLFDLDNTLYPASSNLFPHMHARMQRYIEQCLGVSADEADKLRYYYFKNYGTTMRGLMEEHGIAAQEFMDFVHDVPLDDIGPSASLTQGFEKLPGRKIVFTNADAKHAERILGHLNIRDHFEGIFDIHDGGFMCKPERGPYETLIRRYGCTPEKTCMIDDMQVNLKTAAELGMTTVWMRHEADWLRTKPLPAHHYPHCHHVVDGLEAFFKIAA